jgi:branched-subunit amino acid transport protein
MLKIFKFLHTMRLFFQDKKLAMKLNDHFINLFTYSPIILISTFCISEIVVSNRKLSKQKGN